MRERQGDCQLGLSKLPGMGMARFLGQSYLSRGLGTAAVCRLVPWDPPWCCRLNLAVCDEALSKRLCPHRARVATDANLYPRSRQERQA